MAVRDRGCRPCARSRYIYGAQKFIPPCTLAQLEISFSIHSALRLRGKDRRGRKRRERMRELKLESAFVSTWSTRHGNKMEFRYAADAFSRAARARSPRRDVTASKPRITGEGEGRRKSHHPTAPATDHPVSYPLTIVLFHSRSSRRIRREYAV